MRAMPPPVVVDWPSLLNGPSKEEEKEEEDVVSLHAPITLGEQVDDDYLLREVRSFGKFQRRFIKTVIFPVWFFMGAFTASMSFAVQEPPRFPLCAPHTTERQLAFPPFEPVERALDECDPLVPLEETDCTTPYFYPHKGLTVVSEFMVPIRHCESGGVFEGTAWTNSAFFLGFLIGSGFLGRVGDGRGRKFGIGVALIVMELAGIMILLSGSLLQYGVSRLFLGFGVGGGGFLTFVLITEFTSSRYRPLLAVIQSCSFALGCAYTCVLTVLFPSWRVGVAGVALPALVLLILPCRKILQEGPRWLASRGYGTRALNVWKYVAEINDGRIPTGLTGEDLVQVARNGFTTTSTEDSKDGKWRSARQGSATSIGPTPLFVDPSNETVCKAFRVPPLKRWGPVLLFFWFTSAMSYYGIYFQTNSLMTTHPPHRRLEAPSADVPLVPPPLSTHSLEPSQSELPQALKTPPEAPSLFTEKSTLEALSLEAPSLLTEKSALEALSLAAPSLVTFPPSERLPPSEAQQSTSDAELQTQPVDDESSKQLTAAQKDTTAADELLPVTEAPQATAGILKLRNRTAMNVQQEPESQALSPMKVDAKQQQHVVTSEQTTLPSSSSLAGQTGGAVLSEMYGFGEGYERIAELIGVQNLPMGDAARAVQNELSKGYLQMRQELHAVPYGKISQEPSLGGKIAKAQDVFFHNFNRKDPSFGFSVQRRKQVVSTLISFLLEIPTSILAVCLACLSLGRRGVILGCYLLAAIACFAGFFVRFPGSGVSDSALFVATATLFTIARLLASGGFLLLYLYSSEIFPTVIRASSIGICSTFARIGGILAPLIVDQMEAVASGSALVVFGSCCFFAFVLGACVMPETRGSKLRDTVAQMQRDYQSKKKKRLGALNKEHRETEKLHFELAGADDYDEEDLAPFHN